MSFFPFIIDIKGWYFDIFLQCIIVDANNSTFVLIDFLLIAIS